jgi:tRNA-Thr(GGU) m(6)t(6)A37 methyltransferase TsaA
MQPDRTPILLRPIGIVRSPFVWPYDAPRQGTAGGAEATIELHAEENFEAALDGLAGFERIWVLAVFDRNRSWKPRVHPPRYAGPAPGVFATRSPYRPNPLALSCVRLTAAVGRTLHIAECDLLDGTPVLDIKPYLPYADAFPAARTGWVETTHEEEWTVDFTPAAAVRIAWLAEHGFPALEGFLLRELSWKPDEGKRKRIRRLMPDDDVPGAVERLEIAYRTWRAAFLLNREASSVLVDGISSAYRKTELAPGAPDPHGDKPTHREFRQLFPSAGCETSLPQPPAAKGSSAQNQSTST